MGVLQVPHDKAGDAHYTLISALHKSIRGSDVQASIYWYRSGVSLWAKDAFVARLPRQERACCSLFSSVC